MRERARPLARIRRGRSGGPSAGACARMQNTTTRGAPAAGASCSRALDPQKYFLFEIQGRLRLRYGQLREVCHGTGDQRHGPGFRGTDHRGFHSVPRLDRQFLGGAVFAPEGFHAGLHHGARLYGQAQAGVRPAQHEDHRPFRRSGRQPLQMGERHQGDPDLKISKLYGMLPASAGTSAQGRTPADNQTVRNVFIVGPDKKVKLIIAYPMTTGRNFDEVLRVLDSLQLTAKHKVATPVNWKQGDDVIIAGSVSDEEAKKTYPQGWKAPRPYIRIVPQPRT